MEMKVICPKCNFEIFLEEQEYLYEKYLLCICDNLFLNENFVGDKKLNDYIEEKSRLAS